MNIRTIICTAMGLLALLCVMMFVPKHTYSPQGVLLPDQTVLAPIATDKVTIYHQPPAVNFQTVGKIRIEYRATQIDEDAKNMLFNKVKTLAASAGANGVIVNLFEPNVSEVGPILTFWGTAIYVPNQTGSAHS